MNFLKNIDLRGDGVTIFAGLLGVLYACRVAPSLPSRILSWFSCPVFKVLVLFLIAYSANKNPGIALIVSVGFLVTLELSQRQGSDEDFMRRLDEA